MDHLTSLALGDLNADSILDLVVGGSGESDLSIMLGAGDGTFHVDAIFDTGINHKSMDLVDLNGDGYLDLVSVGGLVSARLGLGDGTFAEEWTTSIAVDSNDVAVDDLNGDGHPDLAIVGENLAGDRVWILIGNGDGTFTATNNYGAGQQPRSITIGDLDGDGVSDLAVASTASYCAALLISRPTVNVRRSASPI